MGPRSRTAENRPPAHDYRLTTPEKGRNFPRTDELGLVMALLKLWQVRNTPGLEVGLVYCDR